MVLVVGSINMDVNILLEHILRPGETLLCRSSVFKSPGGKGSNQAVAAAKLGADVVMLGCVGKDENGQQMLASLQSAGVNTDYVMVKEDCPTSTAYINVAANGENAIAVDSSANMHVSAEYVTSHAELFAKADYCVFQLEIPVETVKAAIGLCRKYNVKTVLNPSPMHPRAVELLTGIDYLIPNETEAEGLLGKPYEETTDADWQAFMEKYRLGHMVITLGSQGCKYYEAGKAPVLYPTRPRQAVDTCGAGDTFLGGFVTAMAEGKNEADAISFAASAAGIQITRSGAQAALPTRTEVEEDMQQKTPPAQLCRWRFSAAVSTNPKSAIPVGMTVIIWWPPSAADAAFRFAVPGIFVADGAASSAADRCTPAGSASSAPGSAEPAGQIFTGDLILTNYFEAIFALRLLS